MTRRGQQERPDPGSLTQENDRVAGPVRPRLGGLRRRGCWRATGSEAVVTTSPQKNEPDWILQSRLKALRIFLKAHSKWGSTSDGIDFDNIKYFIRKHLTTAELG